MASSWLDIRDLNNSGSSISIKNVNNGNLSHGKGMFAEEKFTPNDIICEIQKPLIIALDTARLQDTCYHCYMQTGETPGILRERQRDGGEVESDSITLLRCTSCRTVRYCSKACQKASWKHVHKLECGLFTNLSPRILPNHMRAVISLLQQRSAGTLDDALWVLFKDCPSHIEKFKSPKNPDYVMMMQLTQATKGYINPAYTTDEVLETYCRLKINSVTLMTGWFDPIGVALYPLVAKINHSCTPNAFIKFPFGQRHDKIEVIALQPIRKGEEVTICYIEENYPYWIRQKELRERYFFTCRCDKCEKHRTDIGSDEQFRGALSRRQIFEQQIMKYIHNADTATTLSTSIHNLRYAMYLLATYNQPNEPGWQLSQHPFPEVLQKLIVAYIDDRQYNLALACAAIQHFDVDPEVYTPPAHPLRDVHRIVLHRLVVAAFDPEADYQSSQVLDLRPYDLDPMWWWAYPHDRAGRQTIYKLSDAKGMDELSKMRKLMDDMYVRLADKSVWDT